QIHSKLISLPLTPKSLPELEKIKKRLEDLIRECRGVLEEAEKANRSDLAEIAKSLLDALESYLRTAERMEREIKERVKTEAESRVKEILSDIDAEIGEIKKKIPIFERRIKKKEYESVRSEVSNLIDKIRGKVYKLDELRDLVSKATRRKIARAKGKVTDVVKELESLIELAKPAPKTIEEKIEEVVAKKKKLEKKYTYEKLKAVAKATLRGLGHNPAVVEKALEMLHPTIESLATAVAEGTLRQSKAEDELAERIEAVFGRAEAVPEELIQRLETLADRIERAIAVAFADEVAEAIKSELEDRIEEVAREKIVTEEGLPKKVARGVKEKYRSYQAIREAILRDKVVMDIVCPTCNLEARLRGEPEPNNRLLTSPETRGFFYCPICGGLFKISPITGNPVLVHRFHD
ncbi:hypothetical protein DRJ16_03260, partial [Candidatus Woesearchaeota archaeon]